ncbi:MAG: UDP-N-acetylmuramate dehydrogenase [Candidatus Brennerbacteria bacterium]|nr:UDP-N-acetylmuramate dehydrogenase [Candidatus Brennerbacteria bacterium]
MFKENILLAKYGSYKIGGPARYFFHAKTDKDIITALKNRNKNDGFFILGGGTNILFDDNGFDGLVLKPDLKNISVKKNVIIAGAGVLMEDLLDFCVEHSLSGLEWAGGLPGTLGGAVRGNAGAFGGEIKDSVLAVSSIDSSNLKLIKRKNSQCKFDYRSSVFSAEGACLPVGMACLSGRQGKEIILSVELKLKPGDRSTVKNAIEEKISYRRLRHPIEHFNIGSIFKNVAFDSVSKKHHALFLKAVKKDPFPVIPAAFLLSEAGLKGVALGGAMISPKHPNFIVNVLSAGSADVKNLIALAKYKIKKDFQIELEEEIIYL